MSDVPTVVFGCCDVIVRSSAKKRTFMLRPV